MPNLEETPDNRLTIGQVVKTLSEEFPDISHSSLRFLEREGLITPDRTRGGHRLFPSSQVQRIRTIKEMQQQRLSLGEIQERLRNADRLPDTAAMANATLEHLVAGDKEAAHRIIVEADALGIPMATIFDEILRPVLLETGELWERGELPVGQEKEVSAFSRDLIAFLSERHTPAAPADNPRVIAACVDGEYHELGLRMITALLRQRGIHVYYLGPSVAPDFLVERVRMRHPAAVLLAATRVERQPALQASIASIRAMEIPGFSPQIFAGGAGVPIDGRFDQDGVSVVDESDLASVADEIESWLVAHGPNDPER